MFLFRALLCALAGLLTLPGVSADQCPSPCTCYLQTYPVRANAMDCINIGPDPVPSRLANGTEILKLYHNNISHVPADWFRGRAYTRLQMLYLSYNSIRTVDPAAFRALRLLQALYIDYNDISDLPQGAFTDLHSPVLSLSHNRLETLGPGVFAGHMQQLDISYNNIAEITAGAFQGLWSLEVLKLDNNRLERIEAQAFAGLGNMRYLHLAHNMLTTLEPQTFAGLEKVMFIWLHDNVLDRLQDGTFDDIGSNVVDTIDLSNNHIAAVGPATFRGLREVNDLKLSDNMLTDVPTEALSGLRLTHLYLDYNPISRIAAGAFRGLEGLQILYLANMPELANIEDSAFANLHHLRELYLFGNFLLSAIHRDAFLGLWSLHKLSMWHTALSGLEPDVFRHLRTLKELLLNGNVLSTLDSRIFNCLDSLEEVYLYDNPLRCDCRLRWLRVWMETTTVNFEPDSQWLSCFFGASYRRVTSIALDEFRCNDTEYHDQPTCEPIPTFEPLLPSTPEAERPFVAPPTASVQSRQLNVTTNSITVGWSGVPDGQYVVRFNVIGSADVQVSALKRDPVFTLDGLSAGRVYNICLVLIGPDRGNRALQCTTVSTAKESSNTGVIIGAVLGLLIALLLLVCILVFCCCIRRKKQQQDAEVPVHFSAANGEIKHDGANSAPKDDKKKGRSRRGLTPDPEEPSYRDMAEDNPLIVNGKDDGKMGAVSEMFTNTHAEV
ncbi:leucine-rich repeat-containing protein 15-like [Branchiostoma floridae]|uniref:Leucine-rich repeat-containing protein 15-like n=1 Tax=Branchiostoma floridae TaxID=7739 RepID=A0A9J7N852_BRAFL|nr:leucine-rich repeat-containing protein 15-like [Branchiostoma floridae]XP_035693650.1 leucine-rich repeat-containing protein 15-like [Branchiostoma floridae]